MENQPSAPPIEESPIYALRQTGIVFFLFYTVLCVVSVNSPEFFSDLQDYILELSGELVAVFLIWKARPHWSSGSAETARVWSFVLLGAIFFFLGDTLWFYFEYIRGQEVGVPSACDVFYIISYLYLLAALIIYVKSKKTRSLKIVFFDIVISFLTLSLIVMKYGIFAGLDATEIFDWGRVVNLFYPLIDILFLVGLIALVFISSRTAELLREVGMVAAGFLCFLIADQNFLILSESQEFSTFKLDPVWSLGLLFLSLGALHASVSENQRKIDAQAAITDGVIYFLQTVLPYIFALILVLLVEWEYMFKDSVIFLVNLVIFLIIVRQLDILIKKRKIALELINTQRLVAEQKEMLAIQHNQLQQYHEQKTMEANTDFLTQLKNRRYINETLDQLAETSGTSVNVGLMLIDVDYFKPINDTYGHQMGDDILCLVAKAITSVARGTDIAGRFGGDEFVLILPGADNATLAKVAQRLTDAIAATPLPHPDIQLSLSIGAAAWSSLRADYKKEDLLLRADLALYEVKEAGRKGWRVYEERR